MPTSRTSPSPDPLAPAKEGLRDRGKRRRIEGILKAAREILHEDPDAGFTLPQLAERAEVSTTTVFNLVGSRDDIWAALADQSLVGLEEIAAGIADPRERALRIVDSVMRIIADDAPVFRALIAGWEDSGRVLEREPSHALIRSLKEAQTEGTIAEGVDVRRLGATIFSALVGIVHQWAAGLLTDRQMRARARDAVDVAFAAGRPDNSSPQWGLGR